MKNIEVKEEQFSQVKICFCFKSQHLHQYAKKTADDMWESSGEIRDCHRKVEVFLWRPVFLARSFSVYKLSTSLSSGSFLGFEFR